MDAGGGQVVRHPPNISEGFKALLNDDVEIATYQSFHVTSLESAHGELALKTTYNKQTQRFIVCSPTEVDELLSSLEAEDPELELQSRSWEEMVKAMEDAEAEYALQGSNNKVRNFFRNGDLFAKALKGMSDMIPDEKGLSVLRGGVVFLCSSWSKRIENRERILNTLTDITRHFAKAYEMLQVHSKNEAFRAVVAKFWATLFEAITKLIGILLRKQPSNNKTSKNFVKKTFKKITSSIPTNESDDIDSILKEIERANQDVHAYGKMLKNDRDQKTYQNTVEHQENLLKTGLMTYRLFRSQDQRMDERFETQKNEFNQTIEAAANAMASEVSDLKKLVIQRNLFDTIHVDRIRLRDPEYFHNHLYPLIEEKYYKRGRLQLEDFTITSRSDNTAPIIDIYALIHLLQVPELSPQKDREAVVQQGFQLNADELGRGRWLFNMQPFDDWLRGPESRLLVVDGHCQDICIGSRLSPLSVFCASLAAVLTQNASTIVLHFFCGQHNRATNEFSGPNSLMRSLIFQLLLCVPQDIPFDLAWLTADTVKKIARHELTSLCELFVELLEQLQIDSASTIFCIIDNICDFETVVGDWNVQLKEIFPTLQALVTSPTVKPSFKLLLTSVSTSRLIYHIIKPSERLSLVGRHSLARGGSNQSATLESLGSQSQKMLQ